MGDHLKLTLIGAILLKIPSAGDERVVVNWKGETMDGFAVLLLAFLYFLPTVVGSVRRVPNLGSVMVLNLFLGWSIIGWVVSLAMAARSVPDGGGQTIIIQNAVSTHVPQFGPPAMPLSSPAPMLGQPSGRVPVAPLVPPAPHASPEDELRAINGI